VILEASTIPTQAGPLGAASHLIHLPLPQAPEITLFLLGCTEHMVPWYQRVRGQPNCSTL